MKGKICKASGGRTPMKAAGNPEVFKEAEERKKGGKVAKKEAVKVSGDKPKHRADRKPRKSGGRVGADKHPFSSAHGTTSPSKTPD